MNKIKKQENKIIWHIIFSILGGLFVFVSILLLFNSFIESFKKNEETFNQEMDNVNIKINKIWVEETNEKYPYHIEVSWNFNEDSLFYKPKKETLLYEVGYCRGVTSITFCFKEDFARFDDTELPLRGIQASKINGVFEQKFKTKDEVEKFKDIILEKDMWHNLFVEYFIDKEELLKDKREYEKLYGFIEN